MTSRRPPIFSMNFFLLFLSGIWPDTLTSVISRTLYFLISGIMHGCLLFVLTSYTIGMLFLSDSMLTSFQMCPDVVVCIITFFKIYVLVKNRPLIKALVETLRNDFDPQCPEIEAECQAAEDHSNGRTRRLTACYCALLSFLDAAYIYLNYEQESTGKLLVPQWHPAFLRPLVLLRVAITAVAVCTTGLNSSVFDTLIMAFSMSVGTKLDNLARLIGTFRADMTEEKRTQQLQFCVKMHQRLIRVVDGLEDALSKLTLVQLFESLAAVAMGAYRITSSSALTVQEMFVMVPYFTWLVIQLFNLCWSGENIQTKSKRVATAVMNCDWPAGSVQFRRDLLLIMVRAQRPLSLTALKMVKLRYKVYIDIMKNAYTLHTFLHHTIKI